MDTNIIITETPILEAPSMPSFATPTLGSSLDWGIILRYTLIVLILAFLGFNIFTYLGKVTEETAGFLKPILSIFGYGAATTVKQTTNVAATGAKGLVDVAAGTVTSGVGLLEKGLDAKKTQGQTRNKIDDTTPSTPSTSNAVDQAVTRNKPQQPRGEPMPDDAGSRTQLSRGSGKAGYCYIGEDRGFRSCIKVGEADMCMSGDIFPTQEICINPSLRA
jgi:hypothetical protein